MRLAEPVEEQHFSEGEPDLEPPEELAVGELDEEALLEEELDNEDLLEQDVDEDMLTVTLEDLIHDGDDDDVDDVDAGTVEGTPPSRVSGIGLAGEDEDAEDFFDDLEVDDLEDLEESLDHMLEQRLSTSPAAADGDEVDDEDMLPVGGAAKWAPLSSAVVAGAAVSTLSAVAGCGSGEFVCRSCFLVRRRSQLADASALLCGDCRG